MSRFSLLAFVALSCAAPSQPRALHAPTLAVRYVYKVDVSRAPVLAIEARFDPGGAPDLEIGEGLAGAVTRVSVVRTGGESIVSKDVGRWHIPECAGPCTVRYEVDLSRAERGLDAVSRVGDSYLAPTYAWLLRPAPIMVGTFEVVATGAPPATGAWGNVSRVGELRDLGEGRRGFASSDFGEGSFMAFGQLRAHREAVLGGAVDVAVMDGPLAMGEAGASRWVTDAATCVAGLYGRFPVPQASVFVLPVKGADEPVFGKVLSLGGASVCVLTGEASRADRLHDDWILVHEMVHLGFPTFVGEGRWLGEGVATYYEPILRARMGWRDRDETWRGLAREFPRGLPAGPPYALEQRDGIDDIYWGGALFVMMADVRIRQATAGRHSLDDVMRGVLAKGGDGEHVWRVESVMREGDAITGTHVLTELHARYAARGERVDLDAELRALGIARAGGDVVISDDGPLAWIRRAIVSKEGK